MSIVCVVAVDVAEWNKPTINTLFRAKCDDARAKQSCYLQLDILLLLSLSFLTKLTWSTTRV